MLKAKDGDFFISDWLRNRNTIEYLGIWESVYNLNFNYGEFAIIKSQVGLNSYKLSVKEWVEKTHAIGIKATAGRYGGTFAHPDIAFEFGMWISPQFKIYLVREFQFVVAVTSTSSTRTTSIDTYEQNKRCFSQRLSPILSIDTMTIECSALEPIRIEYEMIRANETISVGSDTCMVPKFVTISKELVLK